MTVFNISRLKSVHNNIRTIQKVSIEGLISFTLLEANKMLDSDMKLAYRNKVSSKRGERLVEGRANSLNFNRNNFYQSRMALLEQSFCKKKGSDKMRSKGLHIVRQAAELLEKTIRGSDHYWLIRDSFWHGIDLLEQAGDFNSSEMWSETLFAH